QLAEARMGPHLIELTPELLDQNLRIYAVLEPLHVKALVPELAVEGLVHAVQPRFSWVDERRVDVGLCQPLQDRPGDEFRAIVTPQVSRRSVHAHQLGEYLDGQTLARVLINHRQTLKLLTIGTGIEDEIICPQISRARCRQRARAAVRNPSSRPLSRHLQTTLAPQAVSSIGAHPMSTTLQEDLDTAIAIRGILGGQFLHHRHHRRIAADQPRLVVQRGPRHRHQRARSSDRYSSLMQVRDLSTTNGRAYHFFAAISFINSISRSRSASSFFSFAFSPSICRSRFTSTASSLPKRLRQAY